MSDTSPASAFCTTRWTLVLRSRGEAPESRAALGELCEAYWEPVYRFLRREGRHDDESRELAQEFFARLLTRGGIGNVDSSRGRFRSYLLGALKHFLAERRRNESREKRGGGATIESLESSGTETSPGLQIADPSAAVPDAWFDREWALAVMDRALKRVQTTFVESGKESSSTLSSPGSSATPTTYRRPTLLRNLE